MIVDDSVGVFERVIVSTGMYRPDICKLAKQRFEVGNEYLLPLEMEDNRPHLWESGCGPQLKKNTQSKHDNVAFGTVIAGEYDEILDGRRFQKKYTKCKFTQALIKVRVGVHMYIGQVVTGRSNFKFRVKIGKLKLVEIGKYKEDSNQLYGKFRVVDTYMNYTEINNSHPAKRLASKLFESNVRKAYFSNAWISPMVHSEEDNEFLGELLSTVNDDVPLIMDATEFIDEVENTFIDFKTNISSMVGGIQWFDFNRGITGLVPIRGLDFADAVNGKGEIELGKVTCCPLKSVIDGFNREFVFNNSDLGNLEQVLKLPGLNKFKASDGVYGVLRCYRD